MKRKRRKEHRSSKLSKALIKKAAVKSGLSLGYIGTPGMIRTCDPLIRSPETYFFKLLLYRDFCRYLLTENGFSDVG